MPDFTESFNFFKAKLEAGEPFALARFGDGELKILRGEKVGNKEFQYDGDEDFRQVLIDAFIYQHPDYYVGIGCPCCIGQTDFMWMRNASGQNEAQLTYNNLFVNANYRRFIDEVIPILNTHTCVLIGPNEASRNIWGEYSFPFHVALNAWRFYDMYTDKMEEILRSEKNQRVFLFSAGPLSEVLIHHAMMVNPSHTYIDIGSTFDPIIFGHPTRGYHSGTGTANKVCHWG